MAIKSEREYRSISLTEFRTEKTEDNEYIVEGYATTFGDEYVLWDEGDVQYKEVIDRDAFDGADMKDVVFLYNHEGMVYARTRNGSLSLSIDDHGLKVRANLGLTEAARQMWETINAGLVDQMSWAFTVKEQKYNKQTHLRTITKVKKAYEVTAVTFPANPATEIATRSYLDGVIESERAERLELRKRQLALKLKTIKGE